MSKSHMFTIIMDTYYRPALLKQAVEALFRQTYDNLEIILVNNGATPETIEYLHQVAAMDKRVKLVHFEENQYSPEDPVKMADVCYNAGLAAATGDYVFYQSDDDMMADDFVEKMVALFKENPECTSAHGLPVTIDLQGEKLKEDFRRHNQRPRYTPGHLLALSYLRGGTMYSAPGTAFAFKREVLIKGGGYHRAVDVLHIFGIVPFGVTGFDETAVFYWRRHEGQLNKLITSNGWLGIGNMFDALEVGAVEQRWQVFGADVAQEVTSTLKKRWCNSIAHWFAIHLSRLRLRACLNVIRNEMKYCPYFWVHVPSHLLNQLVILVRRGAVKWLKPVLWPALKHLFELWPGLANASPKLAKLRERVSR